MRVHLVPLFTAVLAPLTCVTHVTHRPIATRTHVFLALAPALVRALIPPLVSGLFLAAPALALPAADALDRVCATPSLFPFTLRHTRQTALRIRSP